MAQWRSSLLLVGILALALPELGSGCFFWEVGDCKLANTMCGTHAVLMDEAHLNQCNKFVLVFNHAYETCSGANDASNTTLDNFKTCYYEELHLHLPPRESCHSVCEDSHSPTDEGTGPCYENCMYLHTTMDTCEAPEYRYRDAIDQCFQDMADKSPAITQHTCRSACGGHSPNRACWCDPTCVYTNDCCADYENFCQGGRQIQHNTTIPLPNETIRAAPMNVSVGRRNLYAEYHRVPTPEEIGIHVELDNVTALLATRQHVSGQRRAGTVGGHLRAR